MRIRPIRCANCNAVLRDNDDECDYCGENYDSIRNDGGRPFENVRMMGHML